MKSHRHTTVMRFTFWAILVLVFTACSGRAPAATPSQTPPITTPAQTSPPAPTADPSGLSPDATVTLRSLEKLDDYPLYVMHYSGGYDYPQTRSNLPPGSDFSCSLFAAMGEPGDRLYGRNFDWDFSPALLLFTDPPDGYASVSMVDLTFLGINPAIARSLNDLPLGERTALLSAPSMPFDGMNEYGLTIAMAAVPDAYLNDARNDPSRQTIGSIGIIREVLDHARDVDEALAIFEQYNIDFSGGPPIHYLIADPGGKAVLIEFYQAEMVLLPNNAPWHLATNHLRCIAEGNGGCERYRTISERLTSTNGQLDTQGALQLLSEVAQGITQWSAVYDMTSGDISVVVGQSYESVYSFHLDQMRP